MATAALKINIPVFDFDIAQGFDLVIPVKYETAGVPDTLTGASLSMEVRIPDYSKVIDTLSIANGRIVVTGANQFELRFPRVISSAYKISAPVERFIYSLKITTSVVKPILEGSITVKRERTKV